MKEICDKYGQQIEVNADGDSKAVLNAAQERFGAGAVEMINAEGEVSLYTGTKRFKAPVASYRLAAKHAATFDPKTMDLDVWRDAVWDRGEIIRDHCSLTGKTHYHQKGDNEDAVKPECEQCTLTAITPAQYAEETAKVECFAREWVEGQDRGVFAWKCVDGISAEVIHARGQVDPFLNVSADFVRADQLFHPITEAEYARLPAEYAAKYAESIRPKDSPCPFCGSAAERNNITTRVRCSGNPNVCRIAQGMFFTPEQWEMRAGK